MTAPAPLLSPRPDDTIIPYPMPRFTLIPDTNYAQAVISLATHAHSRIDVLQYHFRVPRRPRHTMLDVIAALGAAARRGVAVNILLNRPGRSKRQGPRHGQLLNALDQTPVRLFFWKPNEVFHTKLLAADPDAVLIGSHNLSPASLDSSLNLSLRIRDAELYAAVRKHIDRLFLHATPVPLLNRPPFPIAPGKE